MKLLFDHNLSPRLAQRLSDLFPDSSHVALHGLDQASDLEVWSFAGREGFTLVTKDTDFNDLATLRGAPPKVIWLRIGNCTTADVEQLLRLHELAIAQLGADPNAAILALS